MIGELYRYRLTRKALMTCSNQLSVSIEHSYNNCLAVLSQLRHGDNRVTDSRTIISLTTYGERLNSVHHTIASLLAQSVKVKHVVLWLSNSERCVSSGELFCEQPALLPRQLIKLTDFGLEIRFAEDTKSYKKLIPALTAFPDFNVITFDDDVVYPLDHVKELLVAANKHEQCVVCHRAHRIVINKSRSIAPYSQWEFDVTSIEPSSLIVPIGIGGVYYPAGLFDDVVFDQSMFMSLAPSADDFWFKVMALKNDVRSVTVQCPKPYTDYLHIPGAAETGLWRQNQFKNDHQFANLLNAFPDVLQKVVGEYDAK